MVAILAPTRGHSGGIDRVQVAVEEVGPRALYARAAARQVGHVSGQRRAALEASARVAGHQRFHNDPLSDVQPEGPS